MNTEDLIKTKPGQKIPAAISAVNDVKMTAAELLQAQRHPSHRAHEGGIHHRAIFQVDHKLAITAIDHFLREFLEAPTVEEVALPFHSNPNGGTVYAH